jgi:hypothetical protein
VTGVLENQVPEEQHGSRVTKPPTVYRDEQEAKESIILTASEASS